MSAAFDFQTANGRVEIRELRAMDEMVAAEQIQSEVWGADPHPKELLIAVQYEGGFLAGAFSPLGTMVGLVFSFPTSDPAAQHSQLLATLASWRGLGIGTQLKWFQRRWCLARGIQVIRWTVDPLRAANAELNIRHLGSTSSTYLPDYYGRMEGIDAGVPTDRLLVEWQLSAERVLARLDGPPEDRGFEDVIQANIVEDGRSSCPEPDLSAERVLLCLPHNFIQLAQTDPDLAIHWRMQTRELFQAYFRRGFAVTEFTRVGGPAYLLERKLKNEG